MSVVDQIVVETKAEDADSDQQEIDQEEIDVEIQRLYYNKEACNDTIEKAQEKIKDINIDLEHAECIQKLKNGEIVKVLPEIEFWIKKYHVSKVRVWHDDSKTMIIINFDTKKAISYSISGRMPLPFHWHRQWKGWNMQQID